MLEVLREDDDDGDDDGDRVIKMIRFDSIPFHSIFIHCPNPQYSNLQMTRYL